MTSPDCRVGKHTACSGDAWDDDADDLVACACPCHQTLQGQRDQLGRELRHATGDVLMKVARFLVSVASHLHRDRRWGGRPGEWWRAR